MILDLIYLLNVLNGEFKVLEMYSRYDGLKVRLWWLSILLYHYFHFIIIFLIKVQLWLIQNLFFLFCFFSRFNVVTQSEQWLN